MINYQVGFKDDRIVLGGEYKGRRKMVRLPNQYDAHELKRAKQKLKKALLP